jgi:hypothetical protein
MKRLIIRLLLTKEERLLLIFIIKSRIEYLYKYKILEKSTDYYDVSQDIMDLSDLLKYFYFKKINFCNIMQKIKFNNKEKSDKKGRFARENDQLEINRVITPMMIKYGFDSKEKIEDHYLHEDLSGRTLGCGCMICKLRHQVYKAKNERDKYFNERVKKDALLVLVRGKGKKVLTMLPNDEPFNRFGGYYFLFKKNKFIKKLLTRKRISINTNIEEIQEKLLETKGELINHENKYKKDIKKYKEAIHNLRKICRI